jgi:hypothetical protein
LVDVLIRCSLDRTTSAIERSGIGRGVEHTAPANKPPLWR